MSRKWVERQNLSNYRNENDRLMGEISHLPADLQKEAVHNMISEYKLNEIGKHLKPVQPIQHREVQQTEEEETEGLARHREKKELWQNQEPNIDMKLERIKNGNNIK